MKLICCDLCHAVIPLGYKYKWCKCKNIGGKYHRDGVIAEIKVGDQTTSRVLGLQNGVRYGHKKVGECWIINWFDDHLIVKDIEIL